MGSQNRSIRSRRFDPEALRRGSRLSSDFLVMLGLASAVASLGLLQDSPVIVIGSMLLAPLMTPMISNGLALAQANPKLGRNALLTVFAGAVLTLAVSFVIAVITPGEEMTPQVLSRGEPNVLDLLVAVFSAAAAEKMIQSLRFAEDRSLIAFGYKQCVLI